MTSISGYGRNLLSSTKYAATEAFRQVHQEMGPGAFDEFCRSQLVDSDKSYSLWSNRPEDQLKLENEKAQRPFAKMAFSALGITTGILAGSIMGFGGLLAGLGGLHSKDEGLLP